MNIPLLLRRGSLEYSGLFMDAMTTPSADVGTRGWAVKMRKQAGFMLPIRQFTVQCAASRHAITNLSEAIAGDERTGIRHRSRVLVQMPAVHRQGGRPHATGT
ncbi:hypothetical protein SQW19_09320 [Stenotrophomonas acidaminiphila]|uniref:hypothetical protein n=1 Tax=Stenotrophomonas acidaminiphila TaxID=128780 RepID=UPI002ABD141E|nr:hypothetical protein [Stenotrophomonas acidaminiphila]WPU54573.1 hypothetical protein SQW19_09320 [Stenotrophomonas acidaminiphila]